MTPLFTWLLLGLAETGASQGLANRVRANGTRANVVASPVAVSGVNVFRPVAAPGSCLWASADHGVSHHTLGHGPEWCGLSDGRVGLWHTKGGLWYVELLRASSNLYRLRSLRHPEMCFAMFTTECRRDVCNKDLKTLRLHLTTCIKGSHSSEQWTLHYLGGSKYTIQTAGLSKRCLHSTPKTSLTLSADCSTADLHHSSVWEIYNLAAEIPQAELTWIDHKVRPDVDFSRLTWQKAAELCQGFGADLCFRGDVCPNGADHPPAVGKWDFLQETVPSTSDLWAAYRVCQGPRPVAKMQNKWIQAGRWGLPPSTCITHQEADKSDPTWGPSDSPHTFRKAVACCANRRDTCEPPLLQGAWRPDMESEVNRLAKEAAGKRLADLDFAHRDKLMRAMMSLVGVGADQVEATLAECHELCKTMGDTSTAMLDAHVLQEQTETCRAPRRLQEVEERFSIIDARIEVQCKDALILIIADSASLMLSAMGLGSAVGRKLGRAWADSIFARLFGSEVFRQSFTLLMEAWHEGSLLASIKAVFQLLGGLYSGTGIQFWWKAVRLVFSWWDIVATMLNVVGQLLIWFSGAEFLEIGGEFLQFSSAVGVITEDVMSIKKNCPENLEFDP
ncbi:unnamed protein product [Effrenium voratum]|nr:unnamed protein product [Effrenium voratum]